MGRKDAINSSLDVIVAAAAKWAGGRARAAQEDAGNGGVLQAITTTIHLAQGAPLLGLRGCEKVPSVTI